MTEGNELADAVEAGWQRFRDVLTQLEADALERTTPAGWTAKEMLGHMGFWEEAAEAVVVTMLRGDQLPDDWAFGSGYVPGDDQPWPRSDVHNAREATWAAERTGAEVLARLDAAHQRTRAVVCSLTDDEVGDQRFRDYLTEKAGHYDEHRPELEALLP